MNIRNFCILPNDVVYAKEGGSLMNKSPNDKIVLTMIAISKLYIIRDELYTNIEILIKSIRLKNSKVNVRQIKECLQFLKENKLIECNVENFINMRINSTFEITPNFLQKDKNGNSIYFFQMFDDELDVIMNSDYSEKIKIGVLNLYSFYLATTRSGNPNDIEINLKHFVSYRSYYAITSCINISKKTISKYIDILLELRLIDVRTCGMVIKNNIIKNSPYFVVIKNVFGNDMELIERHMKIAIDQYINKNQYNIKTKIINKNNKIQGKTIVEDFKKIINK